MRSPCLQETSRGAEEAVRRKGEPAAVSPEVRHSSLFLRSTCGRLSHICRAGAGPSLVGV